MAAAPSAILRLNDTLRAHPKRPRSYRFSGVVGDVNHSFGYHLAPNELWGGDYSLQTARDRAGARAHPNMASAWDLKFNSSDMKLVTRRLLNAARAHDPRMHGVREFCGTLNGYDTYPWDLHADRSEGIDSWDASHLWHVHISFYRDVCTNYNALRGVVDVICGVPLRTVSKPSGPPPKYPLSIALHRVYGVSGPNTFNGRHSAQHRAEIKMIQRELVRQGYAGNVNAYTWCDGIYERETAVAVNKLRRQMGMRLNGKVGARVWNKLFGVK